MVAKSPIKQLFFSRLKIGMTELEVTGVAPALLDFEDLRATATPRPLVQDIPIRVCPTQFVPG